jgi:hypothetical protein
MGRGTLGGQRHRAGELERGDEGSRVQQQKAEQTGDQLHMPTICTNSEIISMIDACKPPRVPEKNQVLWPGC